MQATSIRDELFERDGKDHAGLKTATFGMGWFWGPDAKFGVMNGIIRTRVGYAGGTAGDPTYRSMGDHTETVQVEYDPGRIGYDQLLEFFWENHNPTLDMPGRQYISLVLYHSEQQKELIETTRDRLDSSLEQPVVTEIKPAGSFHRAEDYHQKYFLRKQKSLMEEFNWRYTPRQFTDSTLAARFNGAIAGQGDPKLLEQLTG